MFSAFRQQIIAQDVLIAAKMGICIARTAMRSRADGKLLLRLTGHHRAVDFKTTGLRQHFVEPKNLI